MNSIDPALAAVLYTLISMIFLVSAVGLITAIPGIINGILNRINKSANETAES